MSKNADQIKLIQQKGRYIKGEKAHDKCKGTMEFMKERKEELIGELTPELRMLRVKADMTQEELANIIGLSRQTYSQIESGNKVMSWNTYLSLIFFYQSLEETARLLLAFDVYPEKFIDQNERGG